MRTHQRLAALAALLTLALARPAVAEELGATPQTSPLHEHAVERPEKQFTDTKVIPLPIYATLPNEGNTFGFMPVFLIVQKETEHTDSIIAPSISWNKIIRWTTTFRWYHYAADDESLTLIPSISSNINRGVTLEWQKMPLEHGQFTREGWSHFRRTVFSRFFGLGPSSKAGDETSYTNLGGDAGGRIGYNITRFLNVGLTAQVQRQLVERLHVDFLPLTNAYFPNTPGLGGSTELFEGLSLRFDSRPQREYSTEGTAAQLMGGVTQGLNGTSAYGKVQAEVRTLWDELSNVYGGARVFWGYTGGSNIPFYDQSSLGGSFLMRGFTENRFIDKGAWTAELEQRITLFKTHMYGVTSDWRLDPFVAVGQVYQDFAQLTQNVKYAAGVGFRAFVRPNVLGRVDAAVGGEGLKIYVELGYPF